MERLTKRIGRYAHGAEGITKDNLTGNYCRGQFEATACVERLAEYEDLEEQGKLLTLPCAVGDMVYRFRTVDDETKIYEHRLTTLTNIVHIMEIGEIGKTVFLTKEEAEAVLKEMEGLIYV